MIKGTFRKMPASLDTDNKVHYQMRLIETEMQQQEQLLDLDLVIGKKVSILFDGKIFCINCGKLTKTSFGQGFCYNCFQNAPEAAECIIRPELCRAHLGEGRDVQWEQEHHNQPHIVYLAASDVVKVGVTRLTQIPTRWIDQGAHAAIKLAETPNRYEAGVIEVALKQTFVDKTNWRKMLTNQIDESIDLEATKWQLADQLPRDISKFISEEDAVTYLHYPVVEFPLKVQSLTLDKSPQISGVLTGIKGQYLLFDNGSVFNVRKHTGYQVAFRVD